MFRSLPLVSLFITFRFRRYSYDLHPLNACFQVAVKPPSDFRSPSKRARADTLTTRTILGCFS
ncbi:hypothetical protein GLOTRDRAFT_110729 [Gloeophyllum trabeum ATCC 11539]|uniref:Uncharacterized protein n=1 Tax=Gloeophyllum trabeum (strain ATCC 11539 / FP-39264 / Madison 617) TaxID=670483 RepID=S7RP01_GLOTA|nr:uncharacterized protein GLOTRDRAFT_110729 [Gloeophyllum trabeum ATCC 11539]EPQ56265.1 hypothetical protein GLOTRDRAFT_110729 [Gloeophyllum trabeum ATCC 11539]